MSTSDPVHPIPAQGPPGGAVAPAVTGPAAPVPPRSRGRDHVLGAGLALLGSVLGLVAIAVAASRFSPVGPVDAVAIGSAILGGGVLGSVALWGGRSAAAPLVAGGLWTVFGVLGLLPGGPLRSVVDVFPPLPVGGELGTDAVIDGLLTSGVVLLVGITFLGLASATSIARRRGRAWERTEQELRAGGAVTTPPRPRIVSHLLAVVLAVAGSVIALVLVNSFVTERLIDVAALGPRPLVTLTIVLVAAFVVGISGAMSSLGPAAGGLVWLVSVLSAVLDREAPFGVVSDAVGPWLTDLLGARVAQSFFVNAGPAWGVGLLLLGGAVGIHHARRAGRATQRSEHRHIQTQDAAWSDTRG